MVVLFVWQIVTSSKTNQEVASLPPTILPATPTLHAYTTFFTSVPFARQFFVSAASLVMQVAGQLFVASLAGYAFARLRFPGYDIIFAVCLFMLMVPRQLFLLGQFDTMKDLGLLGKLPAPAIPGMFSAFGTFLLRQASRGMPIEFEEAARLDGSSMWRAFWNVMLPMARPMVAALAVLTWHGQF